QASLSVQKYLEFSAEVGAHCMLQGPAAASHAARQFARLLIPNRTFKMHGFLRGAFRVRSHSIV
ncbi:MAG TPA: hypothetical protein VFE25_16000, partial [Opitutaceae bacterium]|nr:hypothetical protein [Opitutaceae bacterium]